MSHLLHRAIAYGVGAVSFGLLAYSTNAQAVAMPFVSKVHELPLPRQTTVFDQRTVGGHEFARGKHCDIDTQILLRSKEPLAKLREHYRKHSVTGAYGAQGLVIRGEVEPIKLVSHLPGQWTHWRNDGEVYLLSFHSPGDGDHQTCRHF